MKDEFGNRMKMYESFETHRKIMPKLPVFARLDGRAFHTFTKGLKQPCDVRFMRIMKKTAKYLLKKSNADIAYVQSDEITLCWKPDTAVFFEGKIFKMTSILASMASVKFNKLIASLLPEKSDYDAEFDCRVFQVPNMVEASNVFLWREQDAIRNSINSTGMFHLGKKTIYKKNQKEILKMLKDAGVSWEYETMVGFKRGIYFKKVFIDRKFTYDEIEKLPAKHEARTNPNLVLTRKEIQLVHFDEFLRNVSLEKRIEYLFGGIE